jgi:hypothetical protein
VHRHVVDVVTVAMIVLTLAFITASVHIGSSTLRPMFQPPPHSTNPTGTAVLGDPTGTSPDVHYVKWANVNRWDADILAAADRFGVPPEYLKAIIAKESGGYWIDPKTGGIIQNPDSHATGLVQAMPDEGNQQLARNLGLDDGYTDPAQNVTLGAAILAQKHDVALSLGYQGEEAWKVAAGGYFGVWPGTMGDTDVLGTSGTQYVSDVIGMVDEIRDAAQGIGSVPADRPSATPTGESLDVGSILGMLCMSRIAP